ncbi:MAG TPA: imelysin family protein [Chryseolinea sp.]
MQLRILVVAIIAGIWGCSGSGSDPSPADNSKDRQEILTHWADNIIIPSYQNFKVKFDVMVSKSNEFTESPTNESLLAFRSAWQDAYAEWQKVELFEFGPADRSTLRNFFNIYPADIAGIDANIADPLANLEVPSSYARQGFPALDYLINGISANDADIVAHYTTGEDAAESIAYLEKLVGRMNTLISNVITEWNTSYRDTFISKTGLDIGSSMGIVVNAYVLNYERYIRSGKFGIPAGIIGGVAGTPYPDKVEAYYKKDISKVLAVNAQEATVGFFNGVNVTTEAEGPSFKSYLDALGAKDSATGTLLSDIINDQFTTVDSKLNVLSQNFYQEIQTNNEAMKDVYAEMQNAIRLLKVDMTSAMSITITYTDNDGD